MNRRALNFALIYSALVIAFKLVILLGGYTLTKFGFYYSNIVGVFFIVPFFFICIKQVRDIDYNGIISGKEAIRIALTILALSILILTIYNYFEFNWKFKEIAIEYYNSQEYLTVLTEQQARYPDKIKTENFPHIIEEQIRELSAFKAATGKLIPMMLIGLSGSFIAAMLLKRSSK